MNSDVESKKARALKKLQLGSRSSSFSIAKQLTPSDIGRWAIEEHIRQRQKQPGRVLNSSGSLRLSGDGVTGHSAPMKNVGEIMSVFQNLVDAIGASINNIKQARGRVPDRLAQKTVLSLSASPQPGSLVLQFAPKLSALEETVDKDGNVSLFDSDNTQLADEAIEEAIRLFELASSDEVLLEEFTSVLQDKGPRVARALERLADQFVSADFNGELQWREPGKATKRASLTKQDFQRISQTISSRDLSTEEIVLEGTMHTVSDRQRLGMDVHEPPGINTVSVKRGNLSDEVLKTLRIGMQVKMTVQARYQTSPLGEEQVEYTALSVEIEHEDA